MQRHNSLQILSWLFSSGYTWNDLHGTGSGPAQDLVQADFSQRIRFKSWTVYEVGTKYEHFKRERLLHDERTEIMPNGAVLQSMVLTNCTPAPTPSVVGSVKQKFGDGAVVDMQERRIYHGIVGSPQYLSIDRCDLHFETNACAKEMKQPTESSWTRLKRLARYLARAQSARVLLILEQTMHRMVHFCESGRTVIRLEMSRTGEVSRVRKLKSMYVRGFLHQANRSHGRTRGGAEYHAAQHRPPMKQC